MRYEATLVAIEIGELGLTTSPILVLYTCRDDPRDQTEHNDGMAEPTPKTPRTHIISRRMIREFLGTVPDRSARAAFDLWFKAVTLSRWDNFADVRVTFAEASWVEGLVVFNVAGNKYRIVAQVDFEAKVVYMAFVGTHKEYDKGKWKA